MNTINTVAKDPVFFLNQAFILNHPESAARALENMPIDAAGKILSEQPTNIAAAALEKVTPALAENIFRILPAEFGKDVLLDMDPGLAVTLLSRMPDEIRESVLNSMSPVTSREYASLLEYPENCVGSLMSARVVPFNKHHTAEEALMHLRSMNLDSIRMLFVIEDDMRLMGELEIQQLVLANPKDRLETICRPVQTVIHAMDSREELTDLLSKNRLNYVPVVDIEFRLVGIIRAQGLVEAVKEDLASSMQSMVGASREERALSPSFFAVKKRLPWLQINLLTAFLAAAVVGMFEDTIARFTALAILLPIAAGQSGNAGAQALAVTMRGLTLREITMKHWLRVMMKELRTGFINGCGIAVTCALGIWLWSRSTGLALVMAIAMVISMTIAGASGALVPIILKRFGLDPAQSSSIVLTTVTDVAGFISFLGIATLLSGLLVAS